MSETKIHKLKNTMIFNLTEITKQTRTYYYHNSSTEPDETIRYVDMRCQRLEKQNVPTMHAQKSVQQDFVFHLESQ